MFEAFHRLGFGLTDADVLSRLSISKIRQETQEVFYMQLWKGAEDWIFSNGKFEVTVIAISSFLRLGYDRLGSGGHDDFFRTYVNWPMETFGVGWKNTSINQRIYGMTLAVHSDIPFEVVYLDFAALKKKGERVARTQAFLIAFDERTRIAASSAWKSATSFIAKLDWDTFLNKVILSNNGPAFQSKAPTMCEIKINKASLRRTLLPGSKRPAERLTWDVKQCFPMYLNFCGGWSVPMSPRLQIITAHIRLPCSPKFAASEQPPYLPVDLKHGIKRDLLQTEENESPQQEICEYKVWQTIWFYIEE